MSGSCCAPHREHSSTVIELNECIITSFNICAVSHLSYAARAIGIITHTKNDEAHTIETTCEAEIRATFLAAEHKGIRSAIKGCFIAITAPGLLYAASRTS